MTGTVSIIFRAACFCHRELIDVGFVCSVCLSIFCKFSPICTTCHTVFKAPGLPMGGGKRGKRASNVGANASGAQPPAKEAGMGMRRKL